MRIIFNDESCHDLTPESNPLEPVIQYMFKHLQHVPLDFKPWDNPYFTDSISYLDLVDQLVELGLRLEIQVDRQRCLDRDDGYFNQLHKIYEINYSGQPHWLDYHETIHLCQRFFYKKFHKATVLDWREKAGPLIKNFETVWLDQHSTTQLKQGDVYIEWNELGKTPYQYWKEHEPNDLTRMCELIKPWSKLRPKFNIAMNDTDLHSRPDMDDFLVWWDSFKDQWCQYHNMSGWNIRHMGVIVVCKLADFEAFDLALKNKNCPKKISL